MDETARYELIRRFFGNWNHDTKMIDLILSDSKGSEHRISIPGQVTTISDRGNIFIIQTNKNEELIVKATVPLPPGI